jgi:hypothetical protein
MLVSILDGRNIWNVPGATKMRLQVQLQILKVRDHLEDLGRDGKMILNDPWSSRVCQTGIGWILTALLRLPVFTKRIYSFEVSLRELCSTIFHADPSLPFEANSQCLEAVFYVCHL